MNMNPISLSPTITMSVRNSPLTPISFGDDEGSSMLKFPTPETDYTHQNNWAPLASPAVSSSSSNMSRNLPVRGTTTSNGNSGAPSSPSAIARPSGAIRTFKQSESIMGRNQDKYESILYEHYLALKRYTSATLKDDNSNSKTNRARDKLLRLSSVQFQELSTDIFDELVRRQQVERRLGINGTPPPPFLPPRENFHPKRNQARQKLSTLPPPRFRDLATDVFFELERRFPRFSSEDALKIVQPASPAGGVPSRIDLPVSGNRLRRPSETSSAQFSIRTNSRSGPILFNNDALPSPNLSPYEFGRPTPKSFQSSTIVPNKSTIVEDDETGGEEGGNESREEEGEESKEGDAFGLEEPARTDFNDNDNGNTSPSTYQQQIRTLNDLLKLTKENLKLKDTELSNVMKNQTDRAVHAETEKKEFKEQIEKLEARLADAQSLNEKLKIELDRVQAAYANENSNLKAQIQELKASQVTAKENKFSSEIERENENLKEDLIQQRRVAEDVRLQAQEILKEMRILSEQSRSSNEREEYLSKNIKRLEDEVKDYKDKYFKTKTQLRNFRGSPSDIAIQRDVARIVGDSEFTNANGMIKDVNVIKFQISIDELLQSSRTEKLDKVLELMRNVIYNVRNITQDIVEATSSGEVTLQQKKLKYNVTITAKNLITASKNFVAAKGLSPVSLLDAAASHLASAIIELLRSVKIRPTPEVEFESDDDMEDMNFIDSVDDSLVRKLDSDNMVSSPNQISSKPFRGLGSVRLSTNSSMYSPVSSPREVDPTTPFSSNFDSWTNQKTTISQQSLSDSFRGIDSYSSMKPTFEVKAQNRDVEQLKIYLEDQTALLVQNVQSLVNAIRSESGITATGNSINAISDVVGNVIYNTEKAMIADKNSELRSQGEPVIRQLKTVQERLTEAGLIGRQIADEGRDDDESEKAWRSWNQSLPPIAFEIAREMKELVIRVDTLDATRIKNGAGIN